MNLLRLDNADPIINLIDGKQFRLKIRMQKIRVGF